MKKRKLDIYPVTLCKTGDAKEFERFLQKYDPDVGFRVTHGTAAATAFIPGPNLLVFYFPKQAVEQGTRKKQKPSDGVPTSVAGTAAHEAAHGAHQVFSLIGESIDDVDEPYAYLVGYFAEWLLEDWSAPRAKR